MSEEPTSILVQRYLDALHGDKAAEPVVRELLRRAAGRLRLLCASFLHKSYPRLTRPPVNPETDELLGGEVAALRAALQTTRPAIVRQLFDLAAQHMRWRLNDLARRLDQRPTAAAVPDGASRPRPAAPVPESP